MTDRLLTFYGDDFTGSTDALEAAASNGIPAVLFLAPPGDALLAKFAGSRVIGIAGESRSRGPAWMSEHLPPIFASLKRMGAPICQYKFCSTFDSSPEFGSIGRAMEIGQRIFGNFWIPVVAAAPHLRRYVLFGNLFAVAGGTVYRIDRHPAMSCHPVTPMHEADLRHHLARQTDLRVELVDILALESGHAQARLDEALAANPGAVLFDGLPGKAMRETGRLIWSAGIGTPRFCAGSAGLTHALMLRWRELGLIPPEFTPAPVRAVDRLIVISGSCSPATGAQIRWAEANGFAALKIDPAAHHCGAVLREALRELQCGRSVVVYSALGLSDRISLPSGDELGRRLGSLLLELVQQSGVRRAVVAGGDTSTHAVRQLGMEALTFAGLLSPGAPLCRGYSQDPAMDGLELVLKGGQVGPQNFFEIVRKGTS